MSNLKPESLTWVDQMEALQAHAPAKRAELQKNLNLGKTQITYLKSLKVCFDQAAIDKVRQAASPQKTGISSPSGSQQANPPFILSFTSAKALGVLKKKKIADLPTTFHAALDITLSRRLDTRHIKALVEWIIAGHPAPEFDPKKAKEKKQAAAVTATDTETEDSEEPEDEEQTTQLAQPASKTGKTPKTQVPGQQTPNALETLVELAKKAGVEEALGDSRQTAAREKLKAHLKTMNGSVPQEKISKKSPSAPETESVFTDWLAGISIFSRIKSKRKKGEPLSSGEYLLLTVHKLVIGLGWLGRHAFKTLKPILKFAWKLLKDVLKDISKIFGPKVYRLVKWVTMVVFICVMVWGVWTVLRHGVVPTIECAGSKILNWFKPAPPKAIATPIVDNTPTQPSPVSLPVAFTNANNALAQPSHVARPDASQQVRPKRDSGAQQVQPIQAWAAQNTESSTGVDQNYLEMEISAIPQYSRVKAFPFQPVNMNADMAAHRLADLQDSDKYSVWWGKDRQKVVSLNPTSSNCTLDFQSGLEGLLGGPSQMEFYWEDVQAIHCSEITTQKDQTTKTIYQISLVVSDAKKPLTVQCDSAVELGHLVSALEFWLKTSRGTTAPLIGLPYLYQGLWLKGDNEVSVVWADSPAGRGKLNPGDMLWCVGGDTGVPRHRSALEAGLSASPRVLYAVSPDDWEKAEMEKNSHGSDVFNPNRRRVILSAP